MEADDMQSTVVCVRCKSYTSLGNIQDKHLPVDAQMCRRRVLVF